MKVLVIGGSGLLGRYLSLAVPGGVETSFTWYTNFVEGRTQYHLDVCNKSQLLYVMEKIKPDVIINCAAIGSVDYAEDHYKEVETVNVKGVGNIAWAAEKYKSKIIYISSNAVYDGDNPPYDEDSKQSPLNIYGRLKFRGELTAKMYNHGWIIIRPFLLYGWPYEGARNNWGNVIYNKLQRKETLNLVNDIYWQPTYAGDIARHIWTLALSSVKDECFNLAAEESLTLYDFGLKVCEVFNLDKTLLSPVSSNKFLSLAKRPVNTRYNLAKARTYELNCNGIEEGLTLMKEKVEDIL